MSRSLYELQGFSLFLQDLMDNDDEDFDPQLVIDSLESLDYEFEDKAKGVGIVLSNFEAESNALKKEIDRLTKRKSVVDNKYNFLKANLQRAMNVFKKKEVVTDIFKFKINKNPPSLKIFDESLIPSHFFIPQPDKIDNGAIKDLLKVGVAVPGARLESGERLDIK